MARTRGAILSYQGKDACASMVGRTVMAGNMRRALSVIERCMSGDGQALHTDKLTLQTILHMGYEAYARTHALPDHVRRAV